MGYDSDGWPFYSALNWDNVEAYRMFVGKGGSNVKNVQSAFGSVIFRQKKHGSVALLVWVERLDWRQNPMARLTLHTASSPLGAQSNRQYQWSLSPSTGLRQRQLANSINSGLSHL
jgi:hypothetical protein